MRAQPLAVFALATTALLAPAIASAQTSASINHVYAGKSSIKITGVRDATVYVKGYSGSLPAIIHYNHNPHTYVEVRVVRRGQTIWREKVEVKLRM